MIFKCLLDGEGTNLQGLQSRNSVHLLQCLLHAGVGRQAGLGVNMGTLCPLGKKIYNAEFYRSLQNI